MEIQQIGLIPLAAVLVLGALPSAAAQCDGPSPMTPAMPAPALPSPITPGGYPVPPGLPIPVGPVTGLSGARAAAESWRYWFEVNRERLVALPARTQAAAMTPRTLPMASSSDGIAELRRTEAALQSELVAPLAQAAGSDQAEVASQALLALARLRAQAPAVEPILLQGLRRNELRVAQTAALALGMLGSPDAVAALLELSEGTREGGRRCGGLEVPRVVRTAAAYGLGLAGSRSKNPHLRERIRASLQKGLGDGALLDRNADREWNLARVVSLGLIADPSFRSALLLQKWELEAGAQDLAAVAQVPVAVARLLALAPAPERERYALSLLARLEQKDGDLDRRRLPGIAAALGELVRPGEPLSARVTAALGSLADDAGRRAEAAGFAMVALGSIAASAAPGSPEEMWILERALSPRDRRGMRSWAALALGIAAKERSAEVAPQGGKKGPSDAVSLALLDRLRSLKDPEEAAAFSLALGLRRCGEASAEIRRRYSSLRDESLRGYLAVALGLLGTRENCEELLSAIETTRHHPWSLSQSALGLALAGDGRGTARLLESLADRSAGGAAAKGAVAMALGAAGDARALRPMLDCLKSTSSATVVAGLHAIGRLADDEPMPWFARPMADFNYPAVDFALLGFLTGI